LWRAAGWDVLVLEDGNDAGSLLDALAELKESNNEKPHVIIANTTKGKGISFMEGSLNWHARPMNQEQYDAAIADLENAKTPGKAT
jgi:transketolase